MPEGPRSCRAQALGRSSGGVLRPYSAGSGLVAPGPAPRAQGPAPTCARSRPAPLPPRLRPGPSGATCWGPTEPPPGPPPRSLPGPRRGLASAAGGRGAGARRGPGVQPRPDPGDLPQGAAFRCCRGSWSGIGSGVLSPVGSRLFLKGVRKGGVTLLSASPWYCPTILGKPGTGL